MKSILSTLFLSLISCIAAAQVELPWRNDTISGSDVIKRPPKPHHGLYLSMSAGPVFGKVTDKFSTGIMTMEGTGAIFDFKIGGVIGNNLILHATIVSQVLAGPRLTIPPGTAIKASDNLNVGEALLGGGLTYYFMPSDIFISASAGIGNFSVIDNPNSSNNFTTQEGFSFQLKAGKEWLISQRWGLGIAFTYGKTRLTNDPGGGTTEKLNSNRFGIVFNATLN